MEENKELFNVARNPIFFANEKACPSPFFTIITSTLNVVNTIERCVDSVICQTFKNYEHIIVDGVSTDGTVDYLLSRKEHFSVLISEPDTGIYNAWNKALKHARGEWILFLGADDILADENVLADVSKFIHETGTKAGIVYGDVMLVSNKTLEDRQLIKVMPNEIGRANPSDLLPLRPPHPGVFHHKSLFFSYGDFDENYKISADAKFLILVTCNKEPAVRVPIVISKMTVGGVSSRIGLIAVNENRRIVEELALPYSKYSWINGCIKARLKFLFLKFLGTKRAYQLIDLVRKLQGKPTLWD